jgi:hypothetical protein
LTSDLNNPCSGCAWFSDCRKKGTAPVGEGLHCLDFVGEETVREILTREFAVHGKNTRS